MSQDILIRPFAPGDAQAFHNLNMQWLMAYFYVEPKDTATLLDPQGTILDPGGQIFVADRNGKTIGCIALLPLLGHSYEVAKMAVDTNAQGLGIGRRRLAAAIEWAKEHGARRLYLESNACLTPALRLYESAGFRHLPEERRPISSYAPADVFTEFCLARKSYDRATLWLPQSSGEDGIMPVVMTMIQTASRKRKREHFQRLQDQEVQAIVVQYENPSLAKARLARLRRRRALALRQPRRAAQSAATSSRLYTPFLRIQRDTKRVKQMLDGIVQGREAERWLAAPNAMLGGARPTDKIRQGKTRQVIEILTVVQESIHI